MNIGEGTRNDLHRCDKCANLVLRDDVPYGYCPKRKGAKQLIRSICSRRNCKKFEPKKVKVFADK